MKNRMQLFGEMVFAVLVASGWLVIFGSLVGNPPFLFGNAAFPNVPLIMFFIVAAIQVPLDLRVVASSVPAGENLGINYSRFQSRVVLSVKILEAVMLLLSFMNGCLKVLHPEYVKIDLQRGVFYFLIECCIVWSIIRQREMDRRHEAMGKE